MDDNPVFSSHEEWLEKFIQHSRVEGNTFVLGCYENKRVTVGAQQVRAINMIEALLRKEILKESLLVVGAGAAGVTAAAYAAYRGIKDVHIVDELEMPLRTFAKSSRLLHPRLYEWPFEDAWDKKEVDLPLLNWSAGPARRIASELLEQWEGWRELYSIHFHPGLRLAKLHQTGPEFAGRTHDLPQTDVVLLAVGFGNEPKKPEVSNATTYWQDDDLATTPGSILICGNGDGALTELFRARVQDFSQSELEDFLKLFPESREFRLAALKIENRCAAEQEQGNAESALSERVEAYRKLVTSAMVEWVRERLRLDTQVTLFLKRRRPTRLFDSLGDRCFPLNRLFATALFIADQPGRIRIHPDSGMRPQPNYEGYNRVFLRTGPKPTSIEQVLGMDEAKESLAEKVQHPQLGDRTRWPMWTEIDATTRALVPHWTEGKVIVAEYYKRVKSHTVSTDFTDSVTQAILFDSNFGEDRSIDHFRGVLRFLALLYDTVQLSDTHVLDGGFFARWFEELRQMPNENKDEYNFLKSRLCVVSRTSDFSAFQQFFFHNGKPKPFEPSIFTRPVRMQFVKWQAEQMKSARNWDAFAVIDDFAREFSKYGPEIERVRDMWKFLNSGEPIFRVSERGSRFPLNEQFEDPGEFFRRQSAEVRDATIKKFWPDRSNRTTVWRILQEAEQFWPADVSVIRKWYNRAYNRAVAVQNNCTAFASFWAGFSPVEAEPAETLTFKENLSGLGRISSAEFMDQVRRLTPTLEEFKRTGDLYRKRDIFAALAEAAPATTNDAVNAEVQSVLNCLKFVEIEQSWIGSRETGPDNGPKVAEIGRDEGRSLMHLTELMPGPSS